MKRISIVALAVLSLSMLLTACGRPSATATPEPSTAAAAPAASTSTPTATPANAANATSAAPAEVLSAPPGEQLTETGATEPVDTGVASQPLGLRINDVKAEPTSQWKEGTHYTRLLPAQPTSALPGQIEVTEMFWYGCPHCYALDPYLENWRKKDKASYVSFVRIPVMWNTVHQTHARIFYTEEVLGKTDELHGAVFEEIHRKNNPLASPEAVQQFFTAHGVSAADFQKAFTSFAVEASLKRAEALGLRYKVESVPIVIINGKYVTDVGRAGGPQQLLALINELASRDHGT